ncbi:endonuclease domain-containing protein [Microbacterium istanbulense]|uniref:DUF559 domain-containing protein n=1 Tax=Microbacterium istanbulense TaxID=3122049 RepID=A0ABU8LKD6_9MICO
MRRHLELPRGLGPYFSVDHAAALGVSDARLRSSDLRSPFHGVRAPASLVSPSELRARCQEYAPRLRDGQFFSHETALALLNVPLPEWPYQPGVHVSAHRPAREPRTRGAVGHRLQLREAAWEVTEDGLPVEHPVRAWRQAGQTWSHEDLVAAAEHMIHPRTGLAEFADLVAEVRTMGDLRGGVLRSALNSVRGGVESPRETRLRLILVRAGLPEPTPGWTLTDSRDRFVARLDLAYRRWRIAPEYDGRQHAESAAQFERDADRWNAIREEGWTLVRVLNHHLEGNGTRAVAMVRRALIDAGWRPGLPG